MDSRAIEKDGKWSNEPSKEVDLELSTRSANQSCNSQRHEELGLFRVGRRAAQTVAIQREVKYGTQRVDKLENICDFEVHKSLSRGKTPREPVI